MRKSIAIIVAAIVVVGFAWFFLDHKSPYPKGLSETSNASSPDQTQNDSKENQSPNSNNGGNQSVKNFMHKITVDTNKGQIIFETYDADSPKSVENFVTLAKKGFYDGTIFHRVIQGFMIQGGDPTGTGKGGPGYKFADELNPATDSYKTGYVRGVVAMANYGPNTNGSQFFVMQKDKTLPHNYTIFGKVLSGMEVVDSIASAKTGQNDKPLENIVMTKVTVSNNQ